MRQEAWQKRCVSKKNEKRAKALSIRISPDVKNKMGGMLQRRGGGGWWMALFIVGYKGFWAQIRNSRKISYHGG